jgi:hypothetical protein
MAGHKNNKKRYLCCLGEIAWGFSFSTPGSPPLCVSALLPPHSFSPSLVLDFSTEYLIATACIVDRFAAIEVYRTTNLRYNLIANLVQLKATSLDNCCENSPYLNDGSK